MTLMLQIVELPNHPYYIGAQFHPEFKSRPGKPSALFLGTMSFLLITDNFRSYASSPNTMSNAGLIAAACRQLDTLIGNAPIKPPNGVVSKKVRQNGKTKKPAKILSGGVYGYSNGVHDEGTYCLWL